MTKIGNKDFQLSPQETQFQEITNSDKTFDNCFFLKNFRYNIANVFRVGLVLKRRLNV